MAAIYTPCINPFLAPDGKGDSGSTEGLIVAFLLKALG
jgi:hypothetical protein